MHLNSKDILGALICCAFLILGLSFWEPGLSYSTYPPLTEEVTTQAEQSNPAPEPFDVDLGLSAANASSVASAAIPAIPGGAASPQTTYDQDSDGNDQPSAIALALRETEPKVPALKAEASQNTDSDKSTSLASKPVVNKPANAANKTAVKKSNQASVTRNKTQPLPVQGSRIGELISWSKASRVFALYDRTLITDVDSGLSFWVQRRGGSKHADSQPLTADDTAIMKKIYGGQWSWERKAIVVTVDDRHLAASMNGMPHAGGAIKNNNFDGHFCIHFQDSRTHGTNKLDAGHQSMVRKAAGK